MMHGRRYTAPMLRAALFALPLAACSMSYHSVSASNHQSKIGLVDYSETTRMEIDCIDGADIVTLEVSVRCTAGSLHLRLIAPDGRCCVDETMRGVDRTGRLEFTPSLGAWKCELDYAGFSGDSSMTLCATGGASFEWEVGSR